MQFIRFILALVPIIWLMVALSVLKLPGFLACIITVIITAFESICIWHFSSANMLTAALEGALNAIWPICRRRMSCCQFYAHSVWVCRLSHRDHFRIYAGDPESKLTFVWINTPGVIILISAVIGGLIQGASPIKLLHVFARTVRTNVRTFVTIMCVLGTAKIMSYFGMTSDMAAFLVAVTGSYYPFIPPLIGTLGGFVTGSGTSTCVLFGPMQVQTAKAIGADPSWLVAANTCGVGIGKMISPQGIAIGAASAGLSGSESRLMASVMKYCILFVVIAGVLSYFLQ